MYRATDFDWVVTVPAIWTAQGKQMMREAAYKVGRMSVDAGGLWFVKVTLRAVKAKPN